MSIFLISPEFYFFFFLVLVFSLSLVRLQPGDEEFPSNSILYDALHCPNAAAGYDLSFFLLTVELLLELAPDPGSLPFFGGPRRPGAMSAGRSFHSVSGRWFWNDLPDATLAGGLTGG